jgi:hypothetical protein
MQTVGLQPMPQGRRPSCPQCGAAFDCSPGGDCWCATEPFRLPMPQAGTEDCLCPGCLRAAAARTAGA